MKRQKSRGRRKGGFDWFTYQLIWDQRNSGVTPNSLLSIPLCGTQPLTQPTPGALANPLVNQQLVTGIEATIFATPDEGGLTTVFPFGVGVGLYVSLYDEDSGLWAQQDPLEPSDAQRDNWLELKQHFGIATSYTAASILSPASPNAYNLSFRRQLNLMVGNGKCLFLALTTSNSNASNASFWFSVRMKVRNDL